MLAPGAGAPTGTEIKPIITVGDTIGSYRYEAIPDGITYLPAGKNAATVFVNHETSTVPFPYTSAPTPANSQNDYDNSQVSKLVIRNGGAVLSASLEITSSANYQRFCSSFIGGSAGGFSRPILFNNEEGIDWVMESGTAWPATEGAPGARQIGAVVAYDVNADQYKTIWGMGRLNHENNVAIPGYGKPVLLSGDDAFVSNPAQSQVYAYIANTADETAGDRISDPVDYVRVTMKDRNGLNDLDQRAEQRQARKQSEQRAAHISPGGEQPERRKRCNMLDFVGRRPRKLGRMRQDGHDEREGRGCPEKQPPQTNRNHARRRSVARRRWATVAGH